MKPIFYLSHTNGRVAALCLLMALVCCSCSDTRDDSETKPATPTAISADENPEATRAAAAPEAVAEALPPLPVPLAYFGESPLSRVTAPVGFTPMEDGSVVLIIVDALNAKHMSAYGYHRETSPQLERLAKEGLLLSNYVSNSSWTRPSFTTIITGLPKSEHGIEWNGNHLDKKITTLAERFRRAGYRTAAVVGNQLVQSIWGFDQGFQTYEDVKTMDQIFPRDGRLVDTAIDWIEKRGDKPFFLMLFLIDPHTPYRPLLADRHFLDTLPEGNVIRFPHREYRTPLPELDHERMVAAYDGEVHSADRQVARLFDYLDTSGKRSSTTVAITADHGEVFDHHGCYTHTYHMWEPVLRVPFVLVSPVLDAKGIYDDRPFTHLDIAPTLLDLAGIDYSPDELSGISIVKALTNPGANRERILFSQYNAHGVRRQAIRKGRWKLVHHHKVKSIAAKKLATLQIPKNQPDPRTLPTLAWDRERYEFYDLQTDPNETKDLFSSRQNTPEFQELSQALQAHLGGVQSEGKITEEMLQALENIGYIQR